MINAAAAPATSRQRGSKVDRLRCCHYMDTRMQLAAAGDATVLYFGAPPHLNGVRHTPCVRDRIYKYTHLAGAILIQDAYGT